MDYTEYLVGLGLSGRSVRLYERHVARAEAWIGRHTHTNLHWAGPKELAAFAETLPDSHSTRGQVVAALRHYWDWKGRSNTPHRAIRVPPAPEMVCRAINEQQARDLIKTALGWWPQGTVVLVGMYLALRRFEIAKMEWARFEDDRQWYRVTGKYGKTHILPVHEILVDELTGRENGSKWLFPGRFGGHIHPATVADWVATVGEAASIVDLEPHELRHTSLATANDRTQDLRSVQTFARHAKPSTTSGYTRTTTRRLREVSDALDYLD